MTHHLLHVCFRLRTSHSLCTVSEGLVTVTVGRVINVRVRVSFRSGVSATSFIDVIDLLRFTPIAADSPIHQCINYAYADAYTLSSS